MCDGFVRRQRRVRVLPRHPPQHLLHLRQGNHLEAVRYCHQALAVAQEMGLAVPGASAYFLGGAVVYTRDARRLLMDIPDEAMKGIRSASEPYAKLLASQVRGRFSTDWGLSETGATGPTGNRYGDAAGHSCMAVAGPSQSVFTLETGSNDRQANMQAFAKTALSLLLENLSK